MSKLSSKTQGKLIQSQSASANSLAALRLLISACPVTSHSHLISQLHSPVLKAAPHHQSTLFIHSSLSDTHCQIVLHLIQALLALSSILLQTDYPGNFTCLLSPALRFSTATPQTELFLFSFLVTPRWSETTAVLPRSLLWVRWVHIHLLACTFAKSSPAIVAVVLLSCKSTVQPAITLPDAACHIDRSIGDFEKRHFCSFAHMLHLTIKTLSRLFLVSHVNRWVELAH